VAVFVFSFTLDFTLFERHFFVSLGIILTKRLITLKFGYFYGKEYF